MGRKTGNLGKAEMEFIEAYFETKTPEWIAEELNRTPHQVRQHIKLYTARQTIQDESKDSFTYKYKLRSRKYWPELQKQFTEDELSLLEDTWIKYIEQFGGDILYTEESQMLDCIKYDLLINRNLVDQSDTIKQIDRLQKQVEAEIQKAIPNIERISALEEQLLAARTTTAARTGEHVKLQSEKNKLLESLKATRDKRIKQLIDDKINIFTLFTQLGEHKGREREAKQGGLFNLALQKEQQKLSKLHKYDDNREDYPILNSEILEQEDGT